jgi:hypothetical protein
MCLRRVPIHYPVKALDEQDWLRQPANRHGCHGQAKTRRETHAEVLVGDHERHVRIKALWLDQMRRAERAVSKRYLAFFERVSDATFQDALFPYRVFQPLC